LIDEKGGMFSGLQPLLARLPVPNPYIKDRKYTLAAFQKFERELQTSHPRMRYNEILPLAYKSFAASLSLPAPSEEESKAFGGLIGDWPAFEDTVPALQALKKHYKLVMLSNIDNDSIARTLAGPLKDVEFDAVYTAQNIGSYKPDLKNFNYLLDGVQKDLGVEKKYVLHTAQSLTHDLVPAKAMGMSGVWIDREDEKDKFESLKDEVNFTWKFDSMGEMAEAVSNETKGR